MTLWTEASQARTISSGPRQTTRPRLIQQSPSPTTNPLITASGVRTLTWSLGELSIGEEGAKELRLRVHNVPEVGSIIRANVSSNNIDLNPADNVVMETRYKAYDPNAGKYKIYLPVVKR